LLYATASQLRAAVEVFKIEAAQPA
jgi:hypothetical protein